jgi:hypothetical protein
MLGGGLLPLDKEIEFHIRLPLKKYELDVKKSDCQKIRVSGESVPVDAGGKTSVSLTLSVKPV